jgi:hypothetical protein
LDQSSALLDSDQVVSTNALIHTFSENVHMRIGECGDVGKPLVDWTFSGWQRWLGRAGLDALADFLRTRIHHGTLRSVRAVECAEMIAIDIFRRADGQPITLAKHAPSSAPTHRAAAPRRAHHQNVLSSSIGWPAVGQRGAPGVIGAGWRWRGKLRTDADKTTAEPNDVGQGAAATRADVDLAAILRGIAH